MFSFRNEQIEIMGLDLEDKGPTLYTILSMDAQSDNGREFFQSGNPAWPGISSMDPVGHAAVQQPAGAPYPPAALQPQSGVAPVNAADGDVIEPEWVAAVENVIEQYRDDPYQLAVAISHLRVEYLKRRYNRAVKVAS